MSCAIFIQSIEFSKSIFVRSQRFSLARSQIEVWFVRGNVFSSLFVFSLLECTHVCRSEHNWRFGVLVDRTESGPQATKRIRKHCSSPLSSAPRRACRCRESVSWSLLNGRSPKSTLLLRCVTGHNLFCNPNRLIVICITR